jgi:hypothetical protein
MELTAAALNKKIDEQVGPINRPSYKFGNNSVTFKFNQLQLMKRVRDEISKMITAGARAIALDAKDDPGAYRRYGLVINWSDEDNPNHVIENNLRWIITLYRMVPDDESGDYSRFASDVDPTGASASAPGSEVNADEFKWLTAPGLK